MLDISWSFQLRQVDICLVWDCHICNVGMRSLNQGDVRFAVGQVEASLYLESHGILTSAVCTPFPALCNQHFSAACNPVVCRFQSSIAAMLCRTSQPICAISPREMTRSSTVSCRNCKSWHSLSPLVTFTIAAWRHRTRHPNQTNPETDAWWRRVVITHQLSLLEPVLYVSLEFSAIMSTVWRTD